MMGFLEQAYFVFLHGFRVELFRSLPIAFHQHTNYSDGNNGLNCLAQNDWNTSSP